MDARHRMTDRDAGYTLVEIMVVVALIAVVAAISVPISGVMISRARADSASIQAVTWLEGARNRAVAERRNFQVTFDTETNRIRIDRVEPDLEPTLIADYQLEEGLEFMQFEDAPDTPDLFGNESDVELEGDTPHMFTSDGSFIDANGDPANGTLFMGKSGQPETARAVTIFGATGVIRTWKLAGTTWFQ
jgi:prepilin-type N-terminal cleavage/methylation domain-containing protein